MARGGVVHHALRHRLDADRGVDDDGRRLHRLQRRQALAQAVGAAGGVDQVDAGVGVVQVQQRAVQRMLHAAFQRVVVADRAAAFQAAGAADDAGLQQQGLGQHRLAGGGGAHEGQGADPGNARGAAVGWAWHGGSPPASAAPRRALARR
jgi:hypothetical protein